MFSNEELKMIHDNVVFRIDRDKTMLSYETNLNKQLFDKIVGMITNDTPPLTETPIEELKEGDSVWAKVNEMGTMKGGLYKYVGIDDENYVELSNGISFHKHKFYNFFTTINPHQTTTPKPKINRAELLDVVKALMSNPTCLYNAEATVTHAIELLNEVNKVTDAAN